jgi:hypothetical protein
LDLHNHRSPSVIMIVWPAKATPVRPDAYADCSQDDARGRASQHRTRQNESEQMAMTDRGHGCFWTIVLTPTTWVMAIGLAVFLFG